VTWLVYALDCPARVDAPALDPRHETEVWIPAGWSVRPGGLPFWPFAAWWGFHKLRIFRNRRYCLILIREKARIIHRSCVFPGYFRFPFMAQEDLQVGDIWTDDKRRGLGLATHGLARAVEIASDRPRRLWYIVEEENLTSIRLAERVGFSCVARGKRTERWGSSLLGSFRCESAD